MYKIIAFLTRKPGMSREAFRQHYETSHVPLVESLTPSIPVYKRSYLADDGAMMLNADLIGFDAITELEFEDITACQAWFEAFNAPDVLQRITDDEEKFLDRSRTMVCAIETEQS